MSKTQKMAAIILWAVAVGAMVAVLTLEVFSPHGLPAGMNLAIPAGGEITQAAGEELPVLFDAPNFSLTNQDGQTTTNIQLRGHPWVGDFIFTTCTTACPIMSTKMAELQKQLPAEVKLVSFSVDPVHDTPPVLKAYARSYHAQPGRWLFLTGDEQTQERVVHEMKLTLIPAEGVNALVHDVRFVLVDGDGHIRGYYDATDGSRITQLVRDVHRLTAGNDRGAGQ